MKTGKNSAGKQVQKTTLVRLWEKVTDFFKPEEVEITFKEDAGGNVVSYTYTVIDHHGQKQVA